MRTNGNDAEPTSDSEQLGRRSVLRGAAGAVAGGLAVSVLPEPAAAGMTVELDVKSNINLESGGVIPVVVKGVAPMFIPVPQPGAPETIIGPRFGPSRLFECDPQGDPILFQQQDEDLCALEQAIQDNVGATPVHGDGHRQGNRSAVLHFRTQEAGFVPEDVENGHVAVTLLYAVEGETGDVEAFVGTDQVKAIPVPAPG